MRSKSFKKSLPLIILALIALSFLSIVTGAEPSDSPTETTTANSEWKLTVDGAVNQPLNLTLSDLAAMPKRTVNSALYCLGSLVVVGNWTGITPEYILAEAGLQTRAASLTFVASDGYRVTLSLTEAFHENVIVAYELDDQKLSENLRLVLPGKNGDQWVAWITQINVSTVPVSTPANNAYLPPKIPQPSSMPHSTYTPQPTSQQPSTPPTDPPPQAVDPTTPQQDFQDPNQSSLPIFTALALILVIIATITGYLYLKRKKPPT